MWKRLKTLVGAITRSLLYLLVPGLAATSESPEHLIDTRRIIFGMQPIVLLGLTAFLIDSGRLAPRAFILAASCLAAGFLTGFLFGVPRVLQSDGADPTGGSGKPPYRQRVNTNLEDISDWLTKIVVGLGLVELKRIPELLDKLAALFCASLEKPAGQQGVESAAIVFFTICGFLLGFLITRLYLQRALSRADQSVGPDLDSLPKEREIKETTRTSAEDHAGEASQ